MIAAGTERAGTAGADPLVAPGVAFLLLFQALFERFDEFVQPAQRLDLRPLFIAQRALELLAQPFVRDQGLKVFIEVLQAVEIGAEGAIELIVVALVLDQNGARQKVKFVHVGEGHAVFERVDQVQQLTHRNRHLGCAHFIEQIQQHAYRLGSINDCRDGS